MDDTHTSVVHFAFYKKKKKKFIKCLDTIETYVSLWRNRNEAMT